MKLNHLRHIVAVAEKGGLRAAARELGIAQPTITRSIAEAERAVGAPLFERSARGAIPTKVGERFLVRAASILAELERAKEEAAQMLGHGVGTVTVALSSVPHLTLLPRALRPFREKFPNISLSIREGLLSVIQQALLEGGVDFYVGPLSEVPLSSHLQAECLFENERVIICRRGHALRRARNIADLAGSQWISTAVTQNAQAELGPLFARHGLAPPQMTLFAETSMTLLMSVAHSDTLALVPQQWQDFPAARELFERIPIEESFAGAPIFAVRRKRMPLTPAAQHLYDLMQRFGQHVADQRRLIAAER